MELAGFSLPFPDLPAKLAHMHTPETIQAVFHALLDPAAGLADTAQQLGLSLPELLEIAESPQITAAIEALEKLAAIRARALTALAAHAAVAALAQIAATDAQTPSAVETRRKAAAQILRMNAKAALPDDPADLANPPLPVPNHNDHDGHTSMHRQGAVANGASPRAEHVLVPTSQAPTRSSHTTPCPAATSGRCEQPGRGSPVFIAAAGTAEENEP